MRMLILARAARSKAARHKGLHEGTALFHHKTARRCGAGHEIESK